MSSSSFITPHIRMILSAIFFSLMGVYAKKLSNQGWSTSWIVLFRSGISLIVLFPIMRYKNISIIGSNHLLLLQRSVYGTVALFFFIYTFSKLKLIQAIILNQLSPLFIILLSSYLTSHKKLKHTYKCLFLTFLGVILTFYQKGQYPLSLDKQSLGAILAGLMGAVLAALAYLTISRIKSKEHSHTTIFHFSFLSTLASIIFIYVKEIQTPNNWEALPILILGLMTFLGQHFLTTAYANHNPNHLAYYGYLTSLFAWIWGVVLFEEHIKWQAVLGIILIIGCGIFLKREENIIKNS